MAKLISQIPWLFELDGEAVDIERLAPLAPACNCLMRPGPDALLCLCGERFEGIPTSREAIAEANKALLLLNGLARLETPQHRPVDLGESLLHFGQRERVWPPDRPRPVRSQAFYFQPPSLGAEPIFHLPVDATVARRRERIVADSRLGGILEAFAGDITWQRLRFALERINALVGKGDNALVKHGYATRAELDQFKANAQDPRHSGVDAVHGVPRGPLKGSKMTEEDGFDFVRSIFNKYVDKNVDIDKPAKTA